MLLSHGARVGSEDEGKNEMKSNIKSNTPKNEDEWVEE
jgi:hypothetical protein